MRDTFCVEKLLVSLPPRPYSPSRRLNENYARADENLFERRAVCIINLAQNKYANIFEDVQIHTAVNRLYDSPIKCRVLCVHIVQCYANVYVTPITHTTSAPNIFRVESCARRFRCVRLIEPIKRWNYKFVESRFSSRARSKGKLRATKYYLIPALCVTCANEQQCYENIPSHEILRYRLSPTLENVLTRSNAHLYNLSLSLFDHVDNFLEQTCRVT